MLARRLRICALLALLVATGVVFTKCDGIACPDGASHAEPVKKSSKSGKGSIDILCRAEDGTPVDGSMPLVLLSWIGLALATFAGTYFAWRAASPLPERVPTATTVPLSDRRERRKQRKREKHIGNK